MAGKLRPLVIGDLTIPIPIIQGGMGVKVSTASLASAVANCGAAGTIASVGLAYGIDERGIDVVRVSNEALRREIREAKRLSRGVIGVNIMVALSNYDELVRTALEENADFIVSGAGLPLKLPELAKNFPTKLLPIVSSGRSAEVIMKTWKRRYNRLPDALVVEGPLAGGHLGFSLESLTSGKSESLEQIVAEVIKVVGDYTALAGNPVPVIAAGGVFDGSDIARFLSIGACGVQIATRFVATPECAVPAAFKELYLRSTEDDLVIIDSPVGLPGRAIKTLFVERIARGERVPFSCSYRCLKTCDPQTAPYCIARALCNATIPDLDNAIVFAGSNVSRVKEILPVPELIRGLCEEAAKALSVPAR